jgi:hypothetical protein
MIHSEIQEEFCRAISDDGELSTPEEYLGPNWETVLHFWKYIGSLSEEQLDVVSARYYELDESDEIDVFTHDSDIFFLSSEVCDYSEEAADSAFDIIRGMRSDSVAEYATYELICMHLLLEQGKKLLYVPLFGNL